MRLERELRATEARLTLLATGRDPAPGSPVRFSLELSIARTADGARRGIVGDADVGGTLAALGQGLIERKAKEILERVTEALGRLIKAWSDAATI